MLSFIYNLILFRGRPKSLYLKGISNMEQSISEIIRNRIKEKNGNFFANHNISEFIKSEKELILLQEEVENKLQDLLNSLVIDTENDHNTKESAKRVAKMYIREIFKGRYTAAPKITSFPNMGYKDLYVTGPISIRSTCAHHFQSIVGKCWIGVFPENEVIGLSKFNRLVHWITERPQIQEEMTTEIADTLIKYAKTKSVAVIVKAEHQCMTMRGVKEHESDMTTAIMRGKFVSDPSLKQEFYNIVSSMKGY